MTATKRCGECGSWGVECGNDEPVQDCGCARCLSTTKANLILGLDAVENLTRTLYNAVQSGAGCCGPAIGRGSRLRQVLDEIEHQRKQPGRPGNLSEEWLSPAEANEMRKALKDCVECIEDVVSSTRGALIVQNYARLNEAPINARKLYGPKSDNRRAKRKVQT